MGAWRGRPAALPDADHVAEELQPDPAIGRAGRLGRFGHLRAPTPIEEQSVVRMNRDTLYSSAVFDLDAGPVTLTLPDPGRRYMMLQILDEDHYTHANVYAPAHHVLHRDAIGTRYVAALVRTMADPRDSEDLARARALQDAIRVEQPGGPGKFEIPDWDAESLAKVRAALECRAPAGLRCGGRWRLHAGASCGAQALAPAVGSRARAR
nr:MAG: hypothetical protein DIU78_20960 [Pseudomonadota bacterium]